MEHDLHKCSGPRFQPNWTHWIGYKFIVLYIFEFIQAISSLPVWTFTTHLVPQKQKINKYSHMPVQKVLYSSKTSFHVSVLSFIRSSSFCMQRISMLMSQTALCILVIIAVMQNYSHTQFIGLPLPDWEKGAMRRSNQRRISLSDEKMREGTAHHAAIAPMMKDARAGGSNQHLVAIKWSYAGIVGVSLMETETKTNMK